MRSRPRGPVDAPVNTKEDADEGGFLQKSVYLTTTMGPSVKLDAKNIPTDIKEYLN